MIQNLFKISLRLLWRDRFFTLLNLTGLAVGLSAALLLMLWVQDELAFDQQHRQRTNIVRVLTNWDFGGEREWTSETPAGLGPAAKEEIPEVQEMIRIWTRGTHTLRVGAALTEAKKCIIADRAMFEVFDFPLAKSDGSKPLSTPNGILYHRKTRTNPVRRCRPTGKDNPLYRQTGCRCNRCVERLPFSIPAQPHRAADYLPAARMAGYFLCQNSLRQNRRGHRFGTGSVREILPRKNFQVSIRGRAV